MKDESVLSVTSVPVSTTGRDEVGKDEDCTTKEEESGVSDSSFILPPSSLSTTLIWPSSTFPATLLGRGSRSNRNSLPCASTPAGIDHVAPRSATG